MVMPFGMEEGSAAPQVMQSIPTKVSACVGDGLGPSLALPKVTMHKKKNFQYHVWISNRFTNILPFPEIISKFRVIQHLPIIYLSLQILPMMVIDPPSSHFRTTDWHLLH